MECSFITLFYLTNQLIPGSPGRDNGAYYYLLAAIPRVSGQQ